MPFPARVVLFHAGDHLLTRVRTMRILPEAVEREQISKTIPPDKCGQCGKSWAAVRLSWIARPCQLWQAELPVTRFSPCFASIPLAANVLRCP